MAARDAEAQHQLLVGMLNGLYPCDPALVRAVLEAGRLGTDQRPQVLDVGSGSGLWAAQMAAEFPHATVVGLDIIQSVPVSAPNNCFFEAHDVTRGLARFYGSFDLVHCRCMAGVVPNHSTLVEQLARCLRPGGLCILGEGDLRVYTEHRILAPMRRSDEDVDPNHSWLARFLYELDAHSSASTIGWHLPSLLTRTAAFAIRPGVDSRQLYVPIGWDGDGTMNASVGQLMKRNCMDFVRSWRPKLLQKGFPVVQIDFWIQSLEQELENPAVLRQYNVWHYAWALRRADNVSLG